MPAAAAATLLCLIGVTVFAAVDAWLLSWSCDDAFISFRYAQNLVDGHGLVFNAGERVEGYTNFAWTVLLAAGMWLGLDAVDLSRWLGTAFFSGTIALFAGVAWRQRTSGAAFVPVAAVGLGAHYHSRLFATAGLETSMFAFLAGALVTMSAYARRPRTWFLTGLVGVLASMTRPDGALLYAATAAPAFVVCVRLRSWRPFVALVIPALVLFVPYWAIKWSYYGYPFPNTFYAKSAAHSYLDQGWLYVSLFFGCYYVLLAAIPALAWLGFRRRDAATRQAVLAVAAMALPYTAFVCYVGGDFMFGRLLLPVAAILLFGLQLPVPFMRPSVARGYGAVILLATFAMAYPDAMRSPDGVTNPRTGARIAEERLFYPPETVDAARTVGGLIKRVIEGTDTRVLIEGGQAKVAFFAEFPVVIEGAGGLTDEHLAHLEIEQRAATGHEKGPWLDPEYLLRRGVHFHFTQYPYTDRLASLREFELLPNVSGMIVTYDRELFAELREGSNGTFTHVDFEDYLDDYLQAIDSKSETELGEDYDAFCDYYFEHNDDRAREQRFRDALGLGPVPDRSSRAP